MARQPQHPLPWRRMERRGQRWDLRPTNLTPGLVKLQPAGELIRQWIEAPQQEEVPHAPQIAPAILIPHPDDALPLFNSPTVDNALHLSLNGEEPTIQLSTREEKGYVSIDIVDDSYSGWMDAGSEFSFE